MKHLQLNTRFLTSLCSTPESCLRELFQNCEQAHASEVTVVLTPSDLTVKDDGAGLLNPLQLLSPGLGIPSILVAFHEATFRSHNWQVTLTPQHLHGERVVILQDLPHLQGFQVKVTFREGHTFHREKVKVLLEQAQACHTFKTTLQHADTHIPIASPEAINAWQLPQATVRLMPRSLQDPRFAVVLQHQPRAGHSVQQLMQDTLKHLNSPTLQALSGCYTQLAIEPHLPQHWKFKADRQNIVVDAPTQQELQQILQALRDTLLQETRQQLQKNPQVMPHQVPAALGRVVHEAALKELGLDVLSFTVMEQPDAHYETGSGWKYSSTRTLQWSGHALHVQDACVADTINHLFAQGRTPHPAVQDPQGFPLVLQGSILTSRLVQKVDHIQVGEVHLPYLLFSNLHCSTHPQARAQQESGCTLLLYTLPDEDLIDLLKGTSAHGKALLGEVLCALQQRAEALTLEDFSDCWETDSTLQSHLQILLLGELCPELKGHLEQQHRLKQVQAALHMAHVPSGNGLPRALQRKLIRLRRQLRSVHRALEAELVKT